MLDIQKLQVVYGTGRLRVDAVKDVSFHVEPAAAYGLVGESGSGKSTVLRAICGLAPVSGGRVLVDGKEVTTPRTKAFYRTVQMVFQDPYASLHPRHTVDRTLSEPLAIHGEKDNAEARILQALREVGLGPSFRFRYPHQLSGGQRQRIAIARALILRPKVLLLDEPTSALDPRQRERLWEFILRLAGEGTTVVYATHHIQEADRYASQLIVLADGERVFGGSPGELERVTGTTGLDFEHAFVEFLRQQGL